MRGLLLASAALLAACQTKSEMRNLPWDAGTTKTYVAPYEKVRNACEDSLRELSFKINERDSRPADSNRYQIMGNQVPTSGNRHARVHIENQQSQCTVWIVVRNRIDSRDTEPADNAIVEDLHKRIANRLK